MKATISIFRCDRLHFVVRCKRIIRKKLCKNGVDMKINHEIIVGQVRSGQVRSGQVRSGQVSCKTIVLLDMEALIDVCHKDVRL